MACVLEIKLSSAIKLEVAHSRAAAMADVDLLAGGSAPPVRLPLEAGTHCALHVRTPPQPEIAEPGDLLIGSITCAHARAREREGARMHSARPITTPLPPRPAPVGGPRAREWP